MCVSSRGVLPFSCHIVCKATKKGQYQELAHAEQRGLHGLEAARPQDSEIDLNNCLGEFPARRAAGARTLAA